MAEPTYTKRMLSASANGKQIKVAAIATPGTVIHQAVASITDKDEIWLYVTNNHTADLALTIEWGGVSVPDDLKQMTIPAKSGDYLIVPGHLLNNSLYVRAFAQTANLLCISGWVNRITE